MGEGSELEDIVRSVLARPPPPAQRPGRRLARQRLTPSLAASGLHLGAPPRLAVASAFAFARASLTVASEVMTLATGSAPKPVDMLGLLLLRGGELELALRCWRSTETAAKKWWALAERHVRERAERFSSDESFGLLLHTGLTALEAWHLGLAALAHASQRPLSIERLQRRARVEAHQRGVLARALVGLKSARGSVSDAERRAVLHQLGNLDVPRAAHDDLQREARRAFRKPPLPPASVPVSRPLRRLILEQVVLASYVDGLREPAEVAYVESLATALGFDARALAAVRVEVAAFYAGHHHEVDAFNMTPLAEALATEAVSDVRHLVAKNTRALLQELKETGELSVLLSRAARGQRLNSDERKRMREQLVDVAKVLPALAIFTAPGGLLLLLALAKLFKFDVRPSAFREE